MSEPTIRPTPAESALLAEIDAMRAELAQLRREVEQLRATPAARAGADEAGAPTDGTTSRRRILAIAGGAAVAAAAGATVGGAAKPAAAADGQPVEIANTAVSSVAKVSGTFLNYAPATSNVDNRHLFLVGDASAAFSPGASKTAAVAGHASARANIGVSGEATVPGGTGVYGRSNTGTGVGAESTSGWDIAALGTGRFYLTSFIGAGPPTVGSFSQGEIVRDDLADLWICVVGGTSSQWRKIGGDTGGGGGGPTLQIIEPTRVYDSRLPGLGGKIASGQSRTISVASGIDLSSGVVNAPDVVPAGATAVHFTFTITGATSQGFLSVTPGDAATYKASAINWSETTPSLASGSLCKLDASRSLKVFADGGGDTHFIIDITGYYH